MIYILVSNTINGKRFAKIGYSKDPKRRFKEIQNMCPLKLKLLLTFNGSFQTEAALHEYFKEYRVAHTNEWFTVNKELKTIIEYWKCSTKRPDSLQNFLFVHGKQKALDKLRTMNNTSVC